LVRLDDYVFTQIGFRKPEKNAQDIVAVKAMPAESQPSVQLQIGHVLFMDLVGYSMLLLDEQRQFQEQLTEIVRDTEQVRTPKRPGN